MRRKRRIGEGVCYMPQKSFISLKEKLYANNHKESGGAVSLAAINLAKAACKKMGMKYSISSCKSVIHNACMLEWFICVSKIKPNTHLIRDCRKKNKTL